MRDVSATYKALRAAVGSRYEIVIVRGSTTYDHDDIMSAVVHQSILGGDVGPSIGGTVSNWCEITLEESSANWPRMASFEIKARLVSEDGETTSEWLSFGTYWTDTRSEDGGYLTITAYDGMMQLQQTWTDKIPAADLPASWPITAAAAADLLEETTGIELDSRDTLDNTVAFIGLNTISTARDIWGDIAAAHGCNAVITPEGYIHLIPLVNGSSGGSSVAGVAVAGVAVVGTSGSGSGGGEDPIYLGLAMRKLKTTPALAAVTGAELTDDAGHVASAGTSTGYVIKAHCNYSNSSAALLCLTHAQGYVYRPFTATRAELDPAAEPGDLVIVDGQTCQIMRIDWDLGVWITADLDAPVEYEVDHEYSVLTEAAVALKKALAADSALETSLRSYIQQTAAQITAGIAAQYVSDSALQDILSQLQETIAGAIELYQGSAVPTLQNYPASGWTTTEEKAGHLGDLYKIVDPGGDNDGKYYRFVRINGVFSWSLLNDNEVEGALAQMALANQAAAEAQAAAGVVQQTLEDNYSPTADIEAKFFTKEEATVQSTALQSEIALTEDRLTVAMTELSEDVDGQFTALAYYIRYQNGVIIIGRTDEPTTVQISPTQISVCYGNETLSYWNQDKQLTPKQLEIPLGGSLRLGDFIWQPRSSGNLSLMYVGTGAQS